MIDATTIAMATIASELQLRPANPVLLVGLEAAVSQKQRGRLERSIGVLEGAGALVEAATIAG